MSLLERRTGWMSLRRRSPPPGCRGSAPVGIALLIAVAVVLAGGVGAAAFGQGGVAAVATSAEPLPSASLAVTATGDRITLTHRGGDSLAVDRMTVRVSVDGEPLAYQPPVPFFSATGFHPGPTGAFNRAGTTTLHGGETASFRVAGTNDPALVTGAALSVTVYVDDRPVAALETRVSAG